MGASPVDVHHDTDRMRPHPRDRATALLAYAVERRLAGYGDALPEEVAGDPWDAWWTCYRAATPADDLAVCLHREQQGCPACTWEAAMLAGRRPPGHPDDLGSTRRCSCLVHWATAMRRPNAATADWPGWRITIGMVKPGGDAAAVRALLSETYRVLDTAERTLTAADVRRLYPDAYGADYVARHDAYLTSAPVTVFVLLADTPFGSSQVAGLKRDIRRRLGGVDVLRNHLHMPDSPGDAFCDLGHLAGTEMLTRLYERYEHDRAAHRLACYRALLDRRDPRVRTG
ncbi:hypothetical protein [Frankia sp. Cr1]|uniref:hypothetical protein n=1 Tax=Frankia sp. Cr1 TaxID=3073931 RepID=UPI002AD2B8D9|nr:hypothetical protein [Frankia sp. Cr1]